MSIVGFEKEKDIFKRAIANDRLVHAYLFAGPDGIGKKLFATYLAKAVFCAEGVAFEDCTCPACLSADAGSNPDLHIIDESPIKIETVRELGESAFMSPMSGKYKFYIIDNVHTMTIPAANAFLKTLEEPGENTVFILLTSKMEQVLPTIRSRCICLNIPVLTTPEVQSVLEKIIPDNDNIESLSKLSSGSVSYALYILENASDTNNLEQINFETQALYDKINSLKEKDDIRVFCALLYSSFLKMYKETQIQDYLSFGNYLLDILRRLDYNVNLDIFKLDLYSKTIEVISENS
jgi:DNA polymerase-3 subunit delta'